MAILVDIEADNYSLSHGDFFLWGFSPLGGNFFSQGVLMPPAFSDIRSANKIISYCLPTGSIIMDGVHLVISHVFIV